MQPGNACIVTTGHIKTLQTVFCKALTLTAFLFFSTGAHAAPVPSGAVYTFSEIPVVLSPNTLEQSPSKSPLTISIIDKKMIEASGARTVPDALRLIPGIVVGHSTNEFGDKPLLVVAYHGHSDQYSKQMNVLVDGRSIYGPLFGGVNWYNIPVVIDDIERIEVTHGPNASTYGANSFQAVINIITRRASEDQGHFAKINAGNHAIADVTYRYAGSNEDIDYRVTVATVNDDGQNREDGSDAYDDISASIIDYRLDYQADNKNQIAYHGSYGNSDQNTEATLRTASLLKYPRRIIEDTSAHQFIRWDSTISTEQSFVLKYFYNYLDEADDFTAQPLDLSLVDPALAGTDPLNLPVNQAYTTERHNIEFTHFISSVDAMDFVWGLSAQSDSVESVYHLYPTGKNSRDTYHLFGSMVWEIDNHNSIDLGLLIEKSDSSDTDISPRFAYLYRLNNNNTFRLGISQAVRTPFIYEQSGQTFQSADITAGGGAVTLRTLENFFIVPENNLKTEKITSIELGHYGRFYQDRVSINTRIFQDTLDDLTAAPRDPTTATPDFDGEAFIFNNAHATTVQGLEIELDYAIDHATRLFASTAFLDISSDDNPRSGKSREYEQSAPDESLSLQATHDFNGKYTGSLNYYHVSDFSFTDANNQNAALVRIHVSYDKLDLRLARNFRFGNERVSAAIILQNLLGDFSDYDPVQGSPQAVVVQDETAFLEIKVRFR